MKAIIMAGGEGSRLRPLTCDLPKPMVPIMNVPVMEHIVNLLKSHGITEIGVTLMYLPQKIKDYFGDGSNFGVKMYYYTEDTPLGTAGSVKNASDFLDETFIVISGDSLTNMDITSAIKFHNRKKSKATLVLTKVAVPLEYGVVITDAQGFITGFLEKPSWGEVFSDTVNTGTYILEPQILNYMQKKQKLDFSQDIFPLLLENQIPMYGYIMSDYWCDIGDLQAYSQAHFDVLNGKINIKHNYTEFKKNIWIGQETYIDQTANIQGPCYIGNNCRICGGAKIGSLSVIGNNNVIETGVSLKRSIIWNNNYFEYGSKVSGSILCNKINIKNRVSVLENAVIGDNCVINEQSIIKPSVKIWPQKFIDSYTTVDRNVIWGARQSKTIFGNSGLSGIINVDVSPEFATRIGAAYGSILKKGSKVVVSSTTSNSARMFKYAFISGILSVGVEVFNMSSLLTPLARYAINFLSVEGGIHIKLSNANRDKLRVDFMDSKGTSISRTTERKIENAFHKEDFKRCSSDEISRLNNITDFKNYYTRSILNDLNILKIKEIAPKICIVSPSDFVISVIVPILLDIGCKVVSFSSANIYETNSIVKEISDNNADFAAFIDSNAESLVLIDKTGNLVKDDLFLSLTTLITLKTTQNATVIVPITAPSIIDELANKFNGSVLRTKTSSQAVMEQMLNNKLYKNLHSMNQFLLNFDAIAGLVKIIEYLCVYNTSLSEALSEIPMFHISKKNVFCPWELKGTVMRKLITEKNNVKIELLDGVKFIFENGWALVLPDADMPLCRVYSEGESSHIAENLSSRYLKKIKEIINV